MVRVSSLRQIPLLYSHAAFLSFRSQILLLVETFYSLLLSMQLPALLSTNECQHFLFALSDIVWKIMNLFNRPGV
jgi:hypothetical protein